MFKRIKRLNLFSAKNLRFATKSLSDNMLNAVTWL